MKGRGTEYTETVRERVRERKNNNNKTEGKKTAPSASDDAWRTVVGTCPSAQQFQPLPGPSHPLPKVSWKAREGRRNEVRRTHQSRLADVPQCLLAFVQTCSRVSKQTWDWLRAAVSESRQPPFGSVTTGVDQSESARGATGENRKNAKTTLGDWGALALGNISQRQTETHTHT